MEKCPYCGEYLIYDVYAWGVCPNQCEPEYASEIEL